MQEQKNYILRTIKTLLNLDEPPLELVDSPAIDKFLQSDMHSLSINALPTKEFRVVGTHPPTEGTVVHITKFNNEALKNFYQFSVRPAQGFQQLSKQITHLYEPVAARTKHPSITQVKELKAVLESQLKKKFSGEGDLSFSSFEEEIDFWQELDMESPSPRVSFFLKEYAAISKSWKNSKGGVELGRLSPLIETTWAVLFNIWQSPYDYQEQRLLRLVEVFEEEIKTTIRLSFAKESDLLEPTFDIRQMIVEALQCCNKFLSLLAQHR